MQSFGQWQDLKFFYLCRVWHFFIFLFLYSEQRHNGATPTAALSRPSSVFLRPSSGIEMTKPGLKIDTDLPSLKISPKESPKSRKGQQSDFSCQGQSTNLEYVSSASLLVDEEKLTMRSSGLSDYRRDHCLSRNFVNWGQL